MSFSSSGRKKTKLKVEIEDTTQSELLGVLDGLKEHLRSECVKENYTQDAAERYLEQCANGAFVIYPNTRDGKIALSYKTNNGEMKHVDFEMHRNYGKEDESIEDIDRCRANLPGRRAPVSLREFLAVQMLPHVSKEGHQVHLISTQHPTEKLKKNGKTSMVLSGAMGCEFTYVCKELHPDLWEGTHASSSDSSSSSLDDLKSGDWVVITGHCAVGSKFLSRREGASEADEAAELREEAADVDAAARMEESEFDEGEALEEDEDEFTSDGRKIPKKFDFNQYVGLLTQAGRLSENDHVNIVLYACKAGAKEKNTHMSFADYLANALAEKGISSTIVASRHVVVRHLNPVPSAHSSRGIQKALAGDHPKKRFKTQADGIRIFDTRSHDGKFVTTMLEPRDRFFMSKDGIGLEKPFEEFRARKTQQSTFTLPLPGMQYDGGTNSADSSSTESTPRVSQSGSRVSSRPGSGHSSPRHGGSGHSRGGSGHSRGGSGHSSPRHGGSGHSRGGSGHSTPRHGGSEHGGRRYR